MNLCLLISLWHQAQIAFHLEFQKQAQISARGMTWKLDRSRILEILERFRRLKIILCTHLSACISLHSIIAFLALYFWLSLSLSFPCRSVCFWWAFSGLFLVVFTIVSSIFYAVKIAAFSGIWSWIVGIEGPHDDHHHGQSTYLIGSLSSCFDA